MVYIDVDISSSDIQVFPTCYFNKNAPYVEAALGSPCYLTNQTVPAGFYSLDHNENTFHRAFWPYYPPYFEPVASATVDGFFGGCTPLDALLASTLDCLYNIDCLNLFVDYFPLLNQVCIL